jgi:hypothetical protein
MAASKAVVQDYDRVGALQREREYRRLAASEIRCEWQYYLATRSVNIHPRKGLRYRQV